jgi:cytosolic carboxypeptidase protein 2/3
VYEYEYDLILKPDYNTRGYTQWYYFRISNTKAGKPYRFNIINLVKPDSLYNHGMRPLVYSETEARRSGRGWIRNGGDICYYQNSMKRKNAGYYYTLTWSITFEHDADVVYLSHSYPYTYTDLQRYLDKLESDPKRKNRMRRKPLCQTIAGNNCDMLICTTFQSDPEAIKSRKGVVISSRVHPGETGASLMMKGVIDYITGPSLNAKILRDNFVFKIIPMLNVDGVVNGSSRCNLAGVDLNRCWIDPSRKQHPTVYHMKNVSSLTQGDIHLANVSVCLDDQKVLRGS